MSRTFASKVDMLLPDLTEGIEASRMQGFQKSCPIFTTFSFVISTKVAICLE